MPKDSADTFADGLATRSVYAMTFEPLRDGLAGFVTVTEAEIAEAVRLLLRTTHNLAEGAGAAGLAGLLRLRETPGGQAGRDHPLGRQHRPRDARRGSSTGRSEAGVNRGGGGRRPMQRRT